MREMKRLLAGFLATALLITSIPGAALADEGEGKPKSHLGLPDFYNGVLTGTVYDAFYCNLGDANLAAVLLKTGEGSTAAYEYLPYDSEKLTISYCSTISDDMSDYVWSAVTEDQICPEELEWEDEWHPKTINGGDIIKDETGNSVTIDAEYCSFRKTGTYRFECQNGEETLAFYCVVTRGAWRFYDEPTMTDTLMATYDYRFVDAEEGVLWLYNADPDARLGVVSEEGDSILAEEPIRIANESGPLEDVIKCETINDQCIKITFRNMPEEGASFSLEASYYYENKTEEGSIYNQCMVSAWIEYAPPAAPALMFDQQNGSVSVLKPDGETVQEAVLDDNGIFRLEKGYKAGAPVTVYLTEKPNYPGDYDWSQGMSSDYGYREGCVPCVRICHEDGEVEQVSVSDCEDEDECTWSFTYQYQENDWIEINWSVYDALQFDPVSEFVLETPYEVYGGTIQIIDTETEEEISPTVEDEKCGKRYVIDAERWDKIQIRFIADENIGITFVQVGDRKIYTGGASCFEYNFDNEGQLFDYWADEDGIEHVATDDEGNTLHGFVFVDCYFDWGESFAAEINYDRNNGSIAIKEAESEADPEDISEDWYIFPDDTEPGTVFDLYLTEKPSMPEDAEEWSEDYGYRAGCYPVIIIRHEDEEVVLRAAGEDPEIDDCDDDNECTWHYSYTYQQNDHLEICWSEYDSVNGDWTSEFSLNLPYEDWWGECIVETADGDPVEPTFVDDLSHLGVKYIIPAENYADICIRFRPYEGNKLIGLSIGSKYIELTDEAVFEEDGSYLYQFESIEDVYAYEELEPGVVTPVLVDGMNVYDNMWVQADANGGWQSNETGLHFDDCNGYVSLKAADSEAVTVIDESEYWFDEETESGTVFDIYLTEKPSMPEDAEEWSEAYGYREGCHPVVFIRTPDGETILRSIGEDAQIDDCGDEDNCTWHFTYTYGRGDWLEIYWSEFDSVGFNSTEQFMINMSLDTEGGEVLVEHEDVTVIEPDYVDEPDGIGRKYIISAEDYADICVRFRPAANKKLEYAALNQLEISEFSEEDLEADGSYVFRFTDIGYIYEYIMDEAGKYEPLVTDDGKHIYTSIWVNAGFGILCEHELTHVERIEATESKAGNEEYWKCEKCGRFYGDEDGEDEIEEDSWIIPATIPDKDFPDVSEKAWYYNVIQEVYKKGLISGYANGSFGPNDLLTRGQFVTILYRMDQASVEYQSYFSDVPDGVYYSAPITWAKETGLVNGYSNGKFGANDPVTREQICIIMYNYANYKHLDVSEAVDLETQFTDAATISSYAKNAVAWCAAKNILRGNNGRVLPRNNATRAEAATIINNFDNLVKGN